MSITVHVTAALPVTVSVEVEADRPEDVTHDMVNEALEELHNAVTYDGYMAEFMVTEGGAWTYEVEN